MEYNIMKVTMKRFWGEKNVKELKTTISDFLISCPGTDMTFAAKVMPSSVTKEELNGYKAKVSDSIQYMGAPKIPIVVIKVDETTGAAEIGIVLYYQYGTAAIEREINFIPMDDTNRERVYDELKAADKTIRFLELVNCKVLKTIHLPVSYNGCDCHARLVYLRDLSLTYRMAAHDEMTDAERFDYCLKGIPEKDYPQDKLDSGMLDAVKAQGYEDAYMESRLLLFSSELRDLKVIYNKPSEKANFVVLPDISSCPDLLDNFPLTDFNVDMYIDREIDYVYNNKHFSIETMLSGVNDYYDFVDGLNSLTTVKNFLNI